MINKSFANDYFKVCIHGKWEKDCIFCWKKDQNNDESQELMDMGACPECGSNHTKERKGIFECNGCGLTAT